MADSNQLVQIVVVVPQAAGAGEEDTIDVHIRQEDVVGVVVHSIKDTVGVVVINVAFHRVVVGHSLIRIVVGMTLQVDQVMAGIVVVRVLEMGRSQ